MSSASPELSDRRAGHRDDPVCSEATVGDAAAWDAFVCQNAAASSYHRYAWRGVIERVFRQRCHYVVARNPAGLVVGVLPLVRLRSLLFGDFLVSLPYFNYGGVVADSDAAVRALVHHAEWMASDLGVQHVEFRHETDRLDTLPRRTDKVSMRLSLPADIEQLRRALPAAVRSQIKRPAREGATVVAGGPELIDEFYAVFAENMRDLGTPVYSRRLFDVIGEVFPRDVRIFIVRVGGRAVAGGFTLGHRRRLEIPWASSLRRFNRIGANMLLYWSILEHAVAERYECFDLGRSTRDSGTYRFKKQWGATPVQLYWHYWLPAGQQIPRLNPDNPRFARAVAAWQRLPVRVANALGPHIVRNLP